MKVEMIIPNQDNDGSDNAELIETCITRFCENYGGATVYQANGFWINEEGRLFKDDVSVIIAAAIEGKKAEEVRDLAKMVLGVTDQEAVFVSINGKAEIIE